MREEEKNKIQEHLETGELWRLSFTEEVCIQSAPERSKVKVGVLRPVQQPVHLKDHKETTVVIS